MTGTMSRRPRLMALGVVVVALGLPAAGRGQVNRNQFGGQDRADSASRMIVLGVQQGISSLPPTSGQSFTYEFDPKLDTYVASTLLGPTSLRSPQTVGARKFSIRIAGSYFELADTKAPIPYLINDAAGNPLGAAMLGLQADAKVGLLNFGGNYGITDRIEVNLNVPVVIVDAQASQIFSTRTDALNVPPQDAPLSGVGFDGSIPQTVADLNDALQPGGPLSLRTENFSALGFNFNEGTHVGVGRISVGAKAVVYADKLAQIAFAPEFFCPSPSEAEFAGSNSPAILPRVIGAFRVSDPVRLHVDAGYDYDFDNNELRRFVWNGGLSYALSNVTVDGGLGGSTFNEGIQWTPTTAPFTAPNGATGTIQALASNRLGRNFLDALGGIKVRVAQKTVLSGSVNVPLNNDGFRAAAVGTFAVEQYF
jgi:Putative MetA-pathway of phenol degradation